MESYYLFTMTVLGIPLPTPRYTYICSSGYLSRICGINCVQTVYMYVYPSLSPQKNLRYPHPCLTTLLLLLMLSTLTYIHTHTQQISLALACLEPTPLMMNTNINHSSHYTTRIHNKVVNFTIYISFKTLKLKTRPLNL